MEFVVDPDKRFQSAIKTALKKVNDLTIPFTLITKEWFQSNKSIFAVTASSGQYADYKDESYKTFKRNHYGFVYPMLKASGRLEGSITNPQSKDSIAVILNKVTLVLGSSTPYAPFLQLGTSKMKARPFVLLGVEQVSPRRLNQRVEGWRRMIEDFTKDVMSGIGTEK